MTYSRMAFPKRLAVCDIVVAAHAWWVSTYGHISAGVRQLTGSSQHARAVAKESSSSRPSGQGGDGGGESAHLSRHIDEHYHEEEAPHGDQHARGSNPSHAVRELRVALTPSAVVPARRALSPLGKGLVIRRAANSKAV